MWPKIDEKLRVDRRKTLVARSLGAFWDADGNRKWAVFTFKLSSHNHIHIAKYFFSIRDE